MVLYILRNVGGSSGSNSLTCSRTVCESDHCIRTIVFHIKYIMHLEIITCRFMVSQQDFLYYMYHRRYCYKSLLSGFSFSSFLLFKVRVSNGFRSYRDDCQDLALLCCFACFVSCANTLAYT